MDVAQPLRGILALRYLVVGATKQMKAPPLTAPNRADELWKHTCFEAFVQPAGSDAYYEFNFSPSSSWAAYRFDGYRAGMTSAFELPTPEITTTSGENQFEIEAKVDVRGLAGLTDSSAWRLALTAILEDDQGMKSYWALKHPPGKPDFHHADGFALELP
ncbi:MAG: DOMON-like domain-containing protein [Proteobacteria bacterium]|nr:DOMON-like domain-containing protein [Pseudomonadota bacterium]